jgi:hypothetical protein
MLVEPEGLGLVRGLLGDPVYGLLMGSAGARLSDRLSGFSGAEGTVCILPGHTFTA